MKALKIPKSKRVTGLHTYCNSCKQYTTKGICHKNKKSISTCKSKEKHVFKLFVAVPNTDGKQMKSRTLKTKDLDQAIVSAFEFRKELEATNYKTVLSVPIKREHPNGLIDCMAMYIGFLNNIGIEEHLIKNRTKAHIKEVSRIFKRFCESLKKAGYSHKAIRVEQITSREVGEFHNFLINDLQYANKTYNKMIACMRQFYAWLIDKKDYELKNPFDGVARRKVLKVQNTIKKSEFENLLQVIKPSNTTQTLKSGAKRYYYKDWLGSAFKLALETGLRREELIELRWNFIEWEGNRPIYFSIPNFKVNRLNGIDGTKESQYKLVPITNGVLRVLNNELDLYSKRDSNEYLFDSNEVMKRTTMCEFISKAFGHFWSLVKSDRKLTLNDLRNTYISNLYKMYGEKTKVVTDHSSIDVIEKHYLDRTLLMDVATKFSVFD